MKALYTILKPIITEKATQMGEKQTYGFYVHPKSTKIDVKMAIKEMYGHDVESVRIMIAPVKKKQVGRRVINKRSEMKKAFITLKGRKKLDITKLGKEDNSSSSSGVKVKTGVKKKTDSTSTKSSTSVKEKPETSKEKVQS